MAYNGREVMKMGRVNYGQFLLLLCMMASLSGCSFRDMLDDYPVSGVEIKLDWTGVTDKLPETMRVIFYPKDRDACKVDAYLPAQGGVVKVPPGNYAVVVYNYNTESVRVEDDESFETIRACTEHCTGLGTDEDMVWAPDAFYVVTQEELQVTKSDTALLIRLKPELVVNNYSFDIKVKGIRNISDVVCYVDGLSGGYSLAKCTCLSSGVPIHVDTDFEDGLLWGYFSHFISPKAADTRADDSMVLTIKIVKVDKQVQEVQVDIKDLIVPPVPDEGEEVPPSPAPDGEIHIEVPVPGGEIEVEVDSGDGGNSDIDGEVDDWEDETDVDIIV